MTCRARCALAGASRWRCLMLGLALTAPVASGAWAQQSEGPDVRDHRRAKKRPERRKPTTRDHRTDAPARDKPRARPPRRKDAVKQDAPSRRDRRRRTGKAAVSVRVRPPSIDVRVEAWERLSTSTNGTAVESKNADDVPVLIMEIFERGIPRGAVDLVFVVDTTGSMKDDIAAVKADMRQILAHLRARNRDSRVGVVAYRDIHDEFLTRTAVFLTRDDARIQRGISELTVAGGDDWPEHVYAGINTALDGQNWRAHASKHIILMGDAPPHQDYENDPRTYEAITAKANSIPRGVRIHTLGIQCDRVCRKALAREKRERARHSSFIP